jgi:hypothetical protein
VGAIVHFRNFGRRELWSAIACVGLLAGCAFDVISIKQMPANFQPTPDAPQNWTLAQDTKVRLREGFASNLKKGTSWKQVGRIEQGDVYRTGDQVVTVEASNQYEAYLVVNNGMAMGFYLPVEKTFTAADPPIAIKTAP